MKVICRKIISPVTKKELEKSPWLTVGKEYLVLAFALYTNDPCIFIISDHYDQPVFSPLSGFEFIDNKAPSSWITVFQENNGCKFAKSLPASWNYDSFFEDLTNDEPKAIKLFNEEAKKIYEEEGWL